MNKKPIRFWEIDAYRGIAIIMMILYHILFDINFLDLYQINLHLPAFRLFLYPIGTSFLLLVGISLTISYSKHNKTKTEKEVFIHVFKRGIKIFFYGLLITFITYLLLGEGYIVFGVLHCIGISILLSYPFLKNKKVIVNLATGVILIILGIILRFFVFDFNFLLWLGFIPRHFYTLDYFPLLPWFGVVLIGISLGKIFYKKNKRSFHINDYSEKSVIFLLSYLGRHSLLIYLFHQPIILFLLLMLKQYL
ncbi:MAG: heparan-alpha-glucosaminide N-acetyltransferase [Thermoplasmatota archaeon]